MRDWLASRANATPTETALLSGPGVDDGRLEYRDLDERVETVAGRLAARGVGVGDALAVRLGTRAEFLELVHAAQRLGAILVPIGTRLTAEEVTARLERVEPTAVVCSTESEPAVVDAIRDADAEPSLLSIGTPVRSAEPLAAIEPEPFDLPEWEKDDPMVVMFTSGTTGEPKGVVLTFGNVLASATASAFRLGLESRDRWHVPLPMYHMGGLAPAYRAVLYGIAVSLQREFEPEATLEAMATTETTCVSLVPTMLKRLLDANADPEGGPDSDRDPLSDLRFVLLGGAPCPPELLERAHERDVPVATTYGMTESASQIATARPEETRRHPGTVGSPLMFASVSILDDSGVPCDAGETGEVVVSGPMITPGYLDAEATERAFTSDGLRTGDVGYRDEDGRLWIEGRADDRIVTGGETVDAAEVAETLRSHPEVEAAAVVGLPDEEWGQRVAALVVRDGPVSADGLETHCRARLAGHKLPRRLEFADALPRTASGTVDRDAVRNRIRTERNER